MNANENQGADQVSQNPRAVQWTADHDGTLHFVDKLHYIGLHGCNNYAQEIADAHNASLKDDKKEDLGSETLATGEHSTVEGQDATLLCPLCDGPITLFGGPIRLSGKQLELIEQWAADDRLWTTQEVVGVNLQIFARTIIGSTTYGTSVGRGSLQSAPLLSENPASPVPQASEVEEDKQQILGLPGAV